MRTDSYELSIIISIIGLIISFVSAYTTIRIYMRSRTNLKIITPIKNKNWFVLIKPDRPNETNPDKAWNVPYRALVDVTIQNLSSSNAGVTEARLNDITINPYFKLGEYYKVTLKTNIINEKGITMLTNGNTQALAFDFDNRSFVPPFNLGPFEVKRGVFVFALTEEQKEQLLCNKENRLILKVNGKSLSKELSIPNYYETKIPESEQYKPEYPIEAPKFKPDNFQD
ncbi:hypothetical protein DS832_07155 [Bombilactobacillus bombi]|uniref:Uncharacterized protein n=1 Tax=Bombilactobacillus bombi TaxID=1303590 RepID=A0A3R6ZUX5_9LACO|nr:hypothetical protein [Bombilactobacillus bombi]RHW46120.1 hypothetical protein DS832_07155 [Bombilactobacillus bombi]